MEREAALAAAEEALHAVLPTDAVEAAGEGSDLAEITLTPQPVPQPTPPEAPVPIPTSVPLADVKSLDGQTATREARVAPPESYAGAEPPACVTELFVEQLIEGLSALQPSTSTRQPSTLQPWTRQPWTLQPSTPPTPQPWTWQPSALQPSMLDLVLQSQRRPPPLPRP